MADKIQAVELTDEELEKANGGLLMFATPDTGSSITGSKGKKKIDRSASATLMTESVQRTATSGLTFSGDTKFSSKLGAVVTSSGPMVPENPGEITCC